METLRYVTPARRQRPVFLPPWHRQRSWISVRLAGAALYVYELRVAEWERVGGDLPRHFGRRLNS